MIYFDNAATTLIKPPEVTWAVQAAMHNAGGYGRSGHHAAMRAGELVYTCRERAASLFHVKEPEQVVFTMNATHALNQAIYALTDCHTHAAVSGYEHNSVIRPLTEHGIPYTILHSPLFDNESMLQSAQDAIEKGANLFIINHVSNVFGSIAPINKLDQILADTNIPLIIDASQSAGIIPIDVQQFRATAAICMPGHKGLMGPQGTGIMLILDDRIDRPLLQGGTGSVSSEYQQPNFLPDRFESGTPNVPGIAGLSEGIHFLLKIKTHKIMAHECGLIAQLSRLLSKINGLECFCSERQDRQAGVLSFRHKRIPAETLAEALAQQGICVRAGLHCSPLAHQSAGTIDTGTVRVSTSFYNTAQEVIQFSNILKEIIENF